MDPDSVIDIFQHALLKIIIIVCITVTPSLVVGLFVSIFQAATQINEQTLSFLPRLLMTLLSLMIFGPWIMEQVLDFCHELFDHITSIMVDS